MDETKALVSIIIPCFNGAPYVEECVDSCLSQTHPKVEIIVVDDGSTDGSVNILKSYGSTICLIEQQNQGAPAARNAGFAQSKGEFIQFLDADDAILPDKLEKQVAFLNTNPDVDVVSCMGYLFRGPKGLRRKQKEQEYPEPQDAPDPFVYCLKYGFGTEGPLLRGGVVEKVGGFRNIPCFQETDLHIRMAATNAKFHRLPDVLYKHSEHDSGTRISRIKRPPSVMLSNMWGLANELLQNSIYDIKSEIRRRALAISLSSFAIYTVRIESSALARDAFSLAEQLSPGVTTKNVSVSIRWMVMAAGRYRYESIKRKIKKLVKYGQ